MPSTRFTHFHEINRARPTSAVNWRKNRGTDTVAQLQTLTTRRPPHVKEATDNPFITHSHDSHSDQILASHKTGLACLVLS